MNRRAFADRERDRAGEHGDCTGNDMDADSGAYVNQLVVEPMGRRNVRENM